jgi:hypothetical protein
MSDAQPSDDDRVARLASQRKAWNDAHPSYYAEYRERNREDIRRKNRERERDRAQREREEKARRQKGIDRARAWAAEHPEERQQARERYKQKHPEAYKQAQRDYYYRNRDAIAERRRAREAADPEKANVARRRAVARARAAGRVSEWSPSPSQEASYRQRENEARRLQRRRVRAGLPDHRLHRVLAAERRHNDAAADAFFARKRRGDEIAQIRNQDLPTPPALVHALGSAQRIAESSARFSPSPRTTSPNTNLSSGRVLQRFRGRASAQGCFRSTFTRSPVAALSK